jgi:hypothetical protein
MTVRTAVQEEVHVHYGQMYVESTEDGLDLHDAFAGQSNGLCGAAVPGGLFLITGLHTGHVGFTAEVHDEEPAPDHSWQEIVEASFLPASDTTVLSEWGGEAYRPLGLAQVPHRVRYSARGMEKAREMDTRMDEDPQQDTYLLQFWPAPPAADRVIKQTSEVADYWHGFARGLPAPSPAQVPHS